MNKRVLVVSNTRTFEPKIKENVKELLDALIDIEGCTVDIFKEDLQLYSLCREYDKDSCNYINSLASKADQLIYNRLHEDYYSKECSIVESPIDYKEMLDKSIKRYSSPTRDKAYDEAEYQSLRESVLQRRMKYVISNIASTYYCLVLINDLKEFNFVNTIKPEYNDGKAILTFNVNKSIKDFAIGGCPLPVDSYYDFIRR